MKNNLYVFLIITFVLSTSMVYANPTSVYVDPPNVGNLAPGNTFTVNIKISDVTNLYGFELKLSWNANILDVVSASGKPSNLWTNNLMWKDNLQKGIYWVGYTEKGSSAFSGSATLATITFKVRSTGTSTLHIYDTILGDSKGNKITYVTKDGAYGSSITIIRRPIRRVAETLGLAAIPDNILIILIVIVVLAMIFITLKLMRKT